MNNCKKCGKETTNPHFCSKSCSTSYNNSICYKRTRILRLCKKCGKDITCLHKINGHPRRLCDDCLPTINQNVTLGELRGRRKYQKSSVVRDMARRACFSLLQEPKCENCGYRKHVEVCHIRPIKSFDDSTPIGVVNAKDNLVVLCPNCHWELDNSILCLSDFR
jgi:hypothetical protein